MPVGVIAAVIAAASAAAGTGYSIYSAENAPGAPKPPSTTPSPLTSAQNASQTAAVSQQLPNLQSLTGGSVSPEYAAQFGATQSGLANDPQASGNIQAAINKFFGLTAPGDSGLTPGGGGIGAGGGGDILSLLTKGKPTSPGVTGGTDIGSDFVSNLLNSDSFKGLTG